MNEEKIENVSETVHIEETETADVSEQVAVTYTHVDIRLKANSISNVAVRCSGTYKSNGRYSNALLEHVSNKVDEEA